MLGEGVTLDVCKSVVSELERRGRITFIEDRPDYHLD
jgi:hypothetical protein